MSILREWIFRIAGVFGRARRERELADEMASHLEMEIEDSVRRGMTRDDARRQALLHAGGVESAKEAYRDQRGIPLLEHAIRDTRYALRTLRRTPMFTATIILSLGLGIGANTALFSLADAIFLRTLPVSRPDELVLLRWAAHDGAVSGSIDGSVSRDDATRLETSTSFSYATYSRFHAGSRTLSSVFAFAPVEQLNVVTDGDAQVAHGQLVTGDYYAGLGVAPYRGRLIGRDDDQIGASAVAVLGYGYWQRRFGGDSSVIGRRVAINNRPTTIIGVTPPEFGGALQVGESADITLAMSADPSVRGNLTNARSAWLRIMARLAPTATRSQAEAELGGPYVESVREAIDAARKELRPGTTMPEPPRLIVDAGGQGLQELRQAYRRSLFVLGMVVLLVLVLACVNVATLLLTRASVRGREITVRLAMGAGRGRLVRQLLTESVLLAFLGEGAGLLIAVAGRNALLALRPWGGQALDVHLALDGRVLFAATAVAVLTGVFFGIAPALRATRIDLAESLKSGARSTRRAGQSRTMAALVVAQVAICVVLLVTAGLFVQTLHNLRRVDVGWNADGLLLFRVDPRLSGYPRARVAALYDRMLEGISAVPTVGAATFTRHPQLSESRRTDGVFVRGHPAPAGTRGETAINNVGPGFFETMQLPILLGRGITSGDRGDAPRVAVINEAMAKAYFGSENPIGGFIAMGQSDGPAFEIVGVAKNAHYYSIRLPVEPIVYLAYDQTDGGQANFTVRFTGDVGATAAAIRTAVRDVDKTLPMFDVRTQRDAAADTMTRELLFARMSGLFGVVAVLLACLGVYGVMSYSTSQRANEIGVRIALGAQAGDITRMILASTLTMVGTGAVLGSLLAVAATRTIAAMLFGLTPTDPRTMAGAVALILVIGGIAGYVPAWRARRISPVTALRHDAS